MEVWGLKKVPWVLNCGHMICESCLMKYKLKTRKCHMCREKFTIRNKRRKRQKELAIKRRKERNYVHKYF